jgi:hypothetical protein
MWEGDLRSLVKVRRFAVHRREKMEDVGSEVELLFSRLRVGFAKIGELV